MAETGLRSGEACGLRLSDVLKDRVTVNQSVWNGQIQDSPKTQNSIRTIALSSELATLLLEQARKQSEKGHTLLFTTGCGSSKRHELIRVFLRVVCAC
jgi:integrase